MVIEYILVGYHAYVRGIDSAKDFEVLCTRCLWYIPISINMLTLP